MSAKTEVNTKAKGQMWVGVAINDKNDSALSKTASSRFAEAIIGITNSPFAILTPAISVSQLVRRTVPEKGE